MTMPSDDNHRRGERRILQQVQRIMVLVVVVAGASLLGFFAFRCWVDSWPWRP